MKEQDNNPVKKNMDKLHKPAIHKDTGVEGTTFWGKVVNAKNNAVAKIKAKEKEQESNPVQAIEAPKSVVLPAENTELDLVGVPA